MAGAPGTSRMRADKEVTMNRKLLWAVLAIGLALVIAPLAMGLPGKTAAGQRMMNGFQPIMQPGQVATTARYYNDVFVPLGTVSPAMNASRGRGCCRRSGSRACGREASRELLPRARERAAGRAGPA